MEIGSDPLKGALAFAERGLDFADAAKISAGPVFAFEDDRFAYREPRFATDGLPDDRLVAVIRTETAAGRRVISMRKADEREQAKYRSRLA